MNESIVIVMKDDERSSRELFFFVPQIHGCCCDRRKRESVTSIVSSDSVPNVLKVSHLMSNVSSDFFQWSEWPVQQENIH